MYGLFLSFATLVKYRQTCIDGFVLRLHRKWTVAILLIASALVTCKQYLGDPIDCIQRDDIPTRLLDTFCWVHATFTLPDAWNMTVGVEVPHPGINRFVSGQQRVYHAYYQWVCFVLFLQALLFYAPYFLWKAIERGRLRNVILTLHMPIVEPKTRDGNRATVVEYLRTHWHTHSSYAVSYLACELLALLNVAGQMLLMDRFLGSEFTTFGTNVLQFTGWDQEYRNDPMVRVFPRMTKCTFHKYGSSGDVQKHDALCILPLNIFNEKIFIFLWFWFIMLITLTCLTIVCRAIVIMIPILRYFLLVIRAPNVGKRSLEIIVDDAKLGDWFFVYLLAKNMDSMHFKDLVRDFAKELDGTDEKEILLRRAADNGTPSGM